MIKGLFYEHHLSAWQRKIDSQQNKETNSLEKAKIIFLMTNRRYYNVKIFQHHSSNWNIFKVLKSFNSLRIETVEKDKKSERIIMSHRNLHGAFHFWRDFFYAIFVLDRIVHWLD